jgi:hypothetical protein
VQFRRLIIYSSKTLSCANERLQILTTLILHIGWHRTASTTIQQALHGSRDLLLKQGVLYPLTGLYGAAHHSIGWSVTDQPIKDWGHLHDFQDLIDQLAEEIRSTACDIVVISTESLRLIVNQTTDAPGRAKLKKLLTLFSQVKVLCCVRHQVPQLESSYRFLVGWKHGLMTISFRNYVREKMLLPDIIYASTEQYFCDLRSDLRFVFWSFSEAIASGNVVDHFFNVAGIDHTKTLAQGLNGTLGREATLAILEWNRSGINQRPERQSFVDWASKIFPDTGTSLYDAEILAIVNEAIGDSNALLEARTGIRFLDTPVPSTFAARCAGQSLHPKELALVHAQLPKKRCLAMDTFMGESHTQGVIYPPKLDKQ